MGDQLVNGLVASKIGGLSSEDSLTSIFIASRIINGEPFSTLWPTFTSICDILQGIGVLTEFIADLPSSP
jgi:hypothetical protein